MWAQYTDSGFCQLEGELYQNSHLCITTSSIMSNTIFMTRQALRQNSV